MTPDLPPLIIPSFRDQAKEIEADVARLNLELVRLTRRQSEMLTHLLRLREAEKMMEK